MTEPSTHPQSAATGLTIAGFVVAIVALLLSFVGAGLLPGLVAAALLTIGERRSRSALGRAGVILAVVALVLSLVILVMHAGNKL